MKFAQLMESRFQRILIVDFGVATLVLLIYGFITIRQTQEKATDFIVSHISQIAQAEVSAQSIADIDREVGQLFGAWKATQDFDIRIDVFLNGKLVGHAGELQKLSPLSVTKIKQFTLPSGQDLSLAIELDVTAHVLFVSVILFILVSFLGGTFFMIRRSARESAKAISRPLEEKVRFVTAVARNLPTSVQGPIPTDSTSVEEITELDRALRILFDEIVNLEGRLIKSAIDKGRLEMAEEVAHNLKSGLSVIQLRIENSAGIGEKDRAHLRTAVHDLANMSQNFIKQSAPATALAVENVPAQAFRLEDAVGRCLDKKREQYKNLSEIQVEFRRSTRGPSFVTAPESEFMAMIANLIDNSVEALGGRGIVRLYLGGGNDEACILIEDNGIGIPKDVLPKLMTYRGTFGKPNGNGLGLFHAKKFISTLKGDIQIQSEVGKGTKVEIKIPLLQSVTAHKINLLPAQTVVILDDEECIHAAWKMKFHDYNVSLEHFHSVTEFENWIQENGLGEPGSRIYLSDYDLKSRAATGLDLIEKYQIQYESFLVTGMSNDPAVVERARRIGLRMIRKDDLHLVELKVADHKQTEQVI